MRDAREAGASWSGRNLADRGAPFWRARLEAHARKSPSPTNATPEVVARVDGRRSVRWGERRTGWGVTYPSRLSL